MAKGTETGGKSPAVESTNPAPGGTGIRPEELMALLAKLPQDAASALLDRVRGEVRHQDWIKERDTTVAAVEKLLESVQGEIMKAVKPGRTLTVFHKPAVMGKDKDGKDVETAPSSLAFSVESDSWTTSPGAVKRTRTNGGVHRVTLPDGRTVEGGSAQDALNQVLPMIPPTVGYRVPESNYSAVRELERLEKKWNGMKYERVEK